jgi:hypothetical protein
MYGTRVSVSHSSLVYKNTGAEWSSPPLILPKPGPDQYHMTVNLRVPNASTKPTAWPMPNLQDVLHELHGSEVFETLDFVKAIGRYLCTKIHKTVSHHAGCSVHTDTCSTWNEEC